LIDQHPKFVLIDRVKRLWIQGFRFAELADKKPGAEVSKFQRVVLTLEINQ